VTAPEKRRPSEQDPADATDTIERPQHSAAKAADATLIAQFAPAGYELRRLDSGAWLVSRWDLSREMTQAELAHFAQRAGVLR
jgi:hypothetical protein